MEKNRAEAYVQKLKELNEFMAGMITSIQQDVNRLEDVRKESRKHFKTPLRATTAAPAQNLQVSHELLQNWQNRVN